MVIVIPPRIIVAIQFSLSKLSRQKSSRQNFFFTKKGLSEERRHLVEEDNAYRFELKKEILAPG